jgi:hypothetical protein
MNARLHFLVDEDFDNDIVRGLLRRLPTLTELRLSSCNLLFTGIMRNRLPRWCLGNLLPSFSFRECEAAIDRGAMEEE